MAFHDSPWFSVIFPEISLIFCDFLWTFLHDVLWYSVIIRGDPWGLGGCIQTTSQRIEIRHPPHRGVSYIPYQHTIPSFESGCVEGRQFSKDYQILHKNKRISQKSQKKTARKGINFGKCWGGGCPPRKKPLCNLWGTNFSNFTLYIPPSSSCCVPKTFVPWVLLVFSVEWSSDAFRLYILWLNILHNFLSRVIDLFRVKLWWDSC